MRAVNPRATRHVRVASLALLLAAPFAGAAEPGDVPTMLTPVLASASIVSTGSEATPACRSVACACRHIRASSMLRLAGEFGQFKGRVALCDTDSLRGFNVDHDWGGVAPAGALGWSQVMRVEKRSSNAGRGAVIGAVVLGSITALLTALASTPAAIFENLGGGSKGQRTIDRAAVGGALVGGLLGAGVGAGVGAGSYHWDLVYVRR